MMNQSVSTFLCKTLQNYHSVLLRDSKLNFGWLNMRHHHQITVNIFPAKCLIKNCSKKRKLSNPQQELGNVCQFCLKNH